MARDERKGLWPDYLELACLADNLTIRPSTGFAPFYLMFGRDLPFPLVIDPSEYDKIDREELLVNGSKNCLGLMKWAWKLTAI